MRTSVLAILTIFAALTAAPAEAQTFGGNYPVCIQMYLRDGARNIECRFTSMEQCQATASGLSATCDANPYYSNAKASRDPTYRRPRRGT